MRSLSSKDLLDSTEEKTVLQHSKSLHACYQALFLLCSKRHTTTVQLFANHRLVPCFYTLNKDLGLNLLLLKRTSTDYLLVTQGSGSYRMRSCGCYIPRFHFRARRHVRTVLRTEGMKSIRSVREVGRHLELSGKRSPVRMRLTSLC